MTDEEKAAIISKYLAATKPPYPRASNRLDYSSIARTMFPVEQLPQGALPVYNTVESICFTPGHPGHLGPVSRCPHPDCIVRNVIET